MSLQFTHVRFFACRDRSELPHRTFLSQISEIWLRFELVDLKNVFGPFLATFASIYNIKRFVACGH